MTRFRGGAPLVVLAILSFACNDRMPPSPGPTPGEGEPVLEKASPSLSATESFHRFVATMTGADNVPPTPSEATGVARLRQNDTGTMITFKILVRDLSDITASHIHLAPSGMNGEVVVTLYDGPTIPGPFTGVLAQGTITAGDLEGSLAGQPLSALIAKINADSAYVNVHTLSFPAGEIRGQLSRGF